MRTKRTRARKTTRHVTMRRTPVRKNSTTTRHDPTLYTAPVLKRFIITEYAWRKLHPYTRKEVTLVLKKKDIIGKIADDVIQRVFREGGQTIAEQLDMDLLENVIVTDNLSDEDIA